MTAKIDIPPDVLRRMYCEDGKTLVVISSELGVSVKTVWDRLNDAGISRRPKGPKNTAIQIAEIDELYWREGMSFPEIGKKIGRDASTIYRRAKKAGMKIRTISEGQRLRYGKSIQQ